MNIVIPMAGLASRFLAEGIVIPKPLIKVNNKTLIEHTLESLNLIGKFIFITRKFDDINYNLDLSKLLKSLCPDSKEICLDDPTSGSVETCLFSSDYINNDEPLIITNCDQKTEWNSSVFLKYLKDEKVDGCVVTHFSDNPKHSYVLTDLKDKVIEIREKEVISNHALIGLHYWKEGRDFVWSGKKLLLDNKKKNKKESYVSESYNYLIKKNKRITYFEIGENDYISLGTPYDLSVYEAKIKEYHTPKPKTLFIDLDGTILKHCHRYSDLIKEPKLLDGALDKFNQWDSQGHKVILCTARKESARSFTEEQLKKMGICWDILLMGLTSGQRIIINDKLSTTAENRANSINLITNKGFKSINWAEFGL